MLSIFVGQLTQWASVSNGLVTFVEVGDAGLNFNYSGAAQNDPFAGDIRIGGHQFDGGGGTLAHAYYPPPNGSTAAGDAHFDIGENWDGLDTGGDGGGGSGGGGGGGNGRPSNPGRSNNKFTFAASTFELTEQATDDTAVNAIIVSLFSDDTDVEQASFEVFISESNDEASEATPDAFVFLLDLEDGEGDPIAAGADVAYPTDEAFVVLMEEEQFDLD